jgi:uncharacterized protein with HEPN domain
MKKDDSIYLRHIIDAFMQIEDYMDGVTHDEFFSNKLLQDGVIRQLEVMGEAARNLDGEPYVDKRAVLQESPELAAEYY